MPRFRTSLWDVHGYVQETWLDRISDTQIDRELNSQRSFSFTIPINHLKKCQQVDRLIFVEYGISGRCRIYECHDRTRFTTYKHKMVAFPIENMSLIWDFEHPAAKEMCELTETKYRQYLNDKELYNS